MSRLFTALRNGRETMAAHGIALSVIGDNISNGSTPGFKGGRVEFNDVIAFGQGAIGNFDGTKEVGAGSKVGEVTSNHSQGTIDFTGREFDMAISGRGFFVLNDGLGNISYTRSGNFSENTSGNLKALSGEEVYGFTPERPDVLGPIPVNGFSDPIVTTNTQLFGNLNVSADLTPVVDNPASFNVLAAASEFTTVINAVNTLGQKEDIPLHFFKTGNLGWTVRAYMDGTNAQGGVTGTPVQIGELDIAFDENGQIITEESMAIQINWSTGAEQTNFTLDMSGLTSLAIDSTLNSVISDGALPGNLVGIEPTTTGQLNARLDTGELVNIGQLAIASFNDPSTLQRQGSNRFSETQTSGEPNTGLPTQEGRGEIVGGSLELANIDPTREFVDLIRFQRGYQAGSQLIQTVNELINGTIQIA